MIIQSESFFENEADTMNEVAEFLGLEPFEFQAADQLQRSWDAGASYVFERPQDYPAMHVATRRLLTDFFEPYNQQLYRLIDENFGWNRVSRMPHLISLQTGIIYAIRLLGHTALLTR